jgi:hypothetical protein
MLGLSVIVVGHPKIGHNGGNYKFLFIYASGCPAEHPEEQVTRETIIDIMIFFMLINRFAVLT